LVISERLNVAKKMADRKKNSRRGQTAALKTPSRKRTQVEKSVEAPLASQEREMVAAKNAAPASEDHRALVSTKSASAPTHEARRQPRQETKVTSRRELKAPPRWRNNPAGRFIYDAYYELRHKVTWPTLKEARNMTFVILALSAVVGGIIALADYGLHELFIFIVTKSWQ
jgi:preprotein translocase SecE subunit